MRKLIASLPNITVTALNGLMCWGINQLWDKGDLGLDTNPFLGLTIVSIILIGILSNQSSNSSPSSERTNLPWLAGLLPMMGSVILFGLLKSNYLPIDLIQYVGLASLFLFVTGTIFPVLIVGFEVWRGNRLATSVSTFKLYRAG